MFITSNETMPLRTPLSSKVMCESSILLTTQTSSHLGSCLVKVLNYPLEQPEPCASVGPGTSGQTQSPRTCTATQCLTLTFAVLSITRALNLLTSSAIWSLTTQLLDSSAHTTAHKFVTMAPNQGLVQPKEYDIKDSNVELIGSDIDHRVKHNSAVTEPAWNDGAVGKSPGLFVWRIEEFQVVPWPKDQYGQFYDGDSYIVLCSYKVGDDGKLGHDIFFWLGKHTTQDEAGTAAYKTVELDEFLEGSATQHREVQASPSDEFLSLFPRISIRAGGVRSGFTHVEEETKEEILTLLRIFKNPSSKSPNSLIVYEVEPHWKSLDDGDVFVLDTGDKIWQWQGKDCSPMEKAKAAQVVHDMTIAKHTNVEVLSQSESRSKRIVDLLGGEDDTPRDGFKSARPVASQQKPRASGSHKKLYRLSDASGELTFDLIKDGASLSRNDLDGNDVFLLDDAGQAVWVWEGQGASRAEKSRWLQVARMYINRLQSEQPDAYLIPLAKVNEGFESKAFFKAVEAAA